MNDRPDQGGDQAPGDLPASRASADSLVSAVLDGEATPEEVEAVRTDPALSGRLAEFERIRVAMLALDEPARTTTRPEERIALALAAADLGPDGADDADSARGADSAGEPGDADSSGTGSVARIEERTRSRRRLGWVAAAAAAVVVLGLGAVVFRTTAQGGSDSLASGDSSAADESAGRAAGDANYGPNESRMVPTTILAGPSADAETGAASAEAAPASPADKATTGGTDLGDFSDLAALRRAAIDATRGITSFVDPPSCATALVGSAPLLSASARLDGAAVVVMVRPDATGPGATVLTVIDPTTCLPVG